MTSSPSKDSGYRDATRGAVWACIVYVCARYAATVLSGFSQPSVFDIAAILYLVGPIFFCLNLTLFSLGQTLYLPPSNLSRKRFWGVLCGLVTYGVNVGLASSDYHFSPVEQTTGFVLASLAFAVGWHFGPAFMVRVLPFPMATDDPAGDIPVHHPDHINDQRQAP